MKNYSLAILSILFISHFSYAQCTEEIVPGETCLSAPLVGCGLDGYVGTSAGFEPTLLFDNFCGLIENSQHFKFIVESLPVIIQITPYNCQDAHGLQAVLYTTEDCINIENASVCASFGFVRTLSLLSDNDIEVGQEVYLLIDGFKGDVCDFEIDVITGLYEEDYEEEEEEEELSCSVDVAVGFGFLRRCFTNRIFVEYCNHTGIDQENVGIQLDLDANLDVDSTSIPIIGQINTQEVSSLFFDIGHLTSGECGIFSTYVTPNCDVSALGEEHCVSAEVIQDSVCEEEQTDWAGANIEVSAACEGNEYKFLIENTGSEDVNENLHIYLKNKDKVIVAFEYDELATGQAFEAEGYAFEGDIFTLVAEQVSGHPLGDEVFGVADCGGPGPRSTYEFNHLVNQSPSIARVCANNIGSYDPNDKAAIPVGWGPEHFIPSGQSLDYKIRFQNTGTDTAFTVVIRDTISLQLDMSSLEAGISSHSYTLDIEEDNILVFTFDNILLPDSTTNLVESNGFVEYSIGQIDGNVPSTIIENTAAIYFDFNEPIITNTVYHTIEKPSVFNLTSLDLCANERYEQQIFSHDTLLSTLHSLPLLDSFVLVDIRSLPVDFVTEEVLVEYGTVVNNTSIITDTTFFEYYTNSFGCDSTIVKNYIVEESNAVNLLSESDWEVYPNPTDGRISILTNGNAKEGNYNVSIFNILGATVYENIHSISPNADLELNLNNLGAGTYLLNISSRYGMLTEKLILNP